MSEIDIERKETTRYCMILIMKKLKPLREIMKLKLYLNMKRMKMSENIK